MIEIIASIIFIVSFAGILFMLGRKIPVLNTLPKNGTTGFENSHLMVQLERKMKTLVVTIEKQLLLHKVLSWVKVITLKIEVKVDSLLHGIRRKAQKIDKDLKAKR